MVPVRKALQASGLHFRRTSKRQQHIRYPRTSSVPKVFRKSPSAIRHPLFPRTSQSKIRFPIVLPAPHQLRIDTLLFRFPPVPSAPQWDIRYPRIPSVPEVNYPQFLLPCFRADRLGTSEIRAFFPSLRGATSFTSSKHACYVPFTPRPGKSPSCLIVVNNPDTPTKRKITDDDLWAICSRLPLPQRCSKHVYTMAFANQTAAEIAQMSAVITLPSLTGSPVHLEPQIHRPYPSRIFSCDTDYLDINHSRVATRVLRALRGPKGGPRASYELLRQDAFEERNLSTRYILRFDYGFRPPCTPWLQCLYIPVEHANGKKKARIWAVFHPEDTSVQCSYCDEHCQRGYSSSCPFAKVIGGQRDE
jgi:hypothetical protein